MQLVYDSRPGVRSRIDQCKVTCIRQLHEARSGKRGDVGFCDGRGYHFVRTALYDRHRYSGRWQEHWIDIRPLVWRRAEKATNRSITEVQLI